jgi:hypothetical protein
MMFVIIIIRCARSSIATEQHAQIQKKTKKKKNKQKKKKHPKKSRQTSVSNVDLQASATPSPILAILSDFYCLTRDCW